MLFVLHNSFLFKCSTIVDEKRRDFVDVYKIKKTKNRILIAIMNGV